jgi:sugar phosphate isomerase/epimerase
VAFRLSALSDEINADLGVALDVMRTEGLTEIEVRTVAGKNVLDLSDAEAQRAAAQIRDAGFTVSGLASPIGKSPITQPAAAEAARLRRALQLCAIFGTRRVRIFSFYPPEGSAQAPEVHLPEATSRLRAMAAAAEATGVELVLENEFRLVGDVPQRIAAILQGVASPALGFAWDPGNFVHSGVTTPFAETWALLGVFTTCAHVKDRRADGQHVPAGEGDGQWPELLAALAQRGGVPLVIEPHLKVAGHSTGYSGPDLFRQALRAIRTLLASV